ncbi:MAG: alpha/beta hydrolase [Magnetococcales bacterium]|nr:alpha/beta hydrolase [Magnetococcales bacterium]
MDNKPRRLLLIHGLGESALCFLSLRATWTQQGWEVMAPDLPGYGQRHAQAPATFDEMVGELAGCLTEPSVVLGHSMGGVLGLLLCVRYPEHIAAFINVEGNLSDADCTFSSLAIAQTEKHFLAKGFHDLLTSSLLNGLGQGDARQGSYRERMAGCNPLAFYRNSQELVQQSVNGQLIEQFRDAIPGVPRVYMAGDTAGGVSQQSRQRLRQAAIPLIVVPDSGHWPFLEAPDTFDYLLKPLLTGQGGYPLT